MRTLIVATLALAPVLAQAQTVQPELTAKLNAAPAFAAAATPAPKTVSTRPISTGVVAPKLIRITPVEISSTPTAYSHATDATLGDVTVSMLVDEKGIPENLKVTGSANPDLDTAVLNAVSQYRFTPGSVNNVPFAVPVNLHVTVRNPNAL